MVIFEKVRYCFMYPFDRLVLDKYSVMPISYPFFLRF